MGFSDDATGRQDRKTSSLEEKEAISRRLGKHNKNVSLKSSSFRVMSRRHRNDDSLNLLIDNTECIIKHVGLGQTNHKNLVERLLFSA